MGGIGYLFATKRRVYTSRLFSILNPEVRVARAQGKQGIWFLFFPDRDVLNPEVRVARAQGKQGIWFLLFPDRENTGNFALAQGKILKHRENVFL